MLFGKNTLYTHTWRTLGLGTSSHVDHRLIWGLSVVRLQCGDTGALAQFDLTVALFDDLHLPVSLLEENPVHSHPSGLTHLVHPTGGQLLQWVCALWNCGAPGPQLYKVKKN